MSLEYLALALSLGPIHPTLQKLLWAQRAVKAFPSIVVPLWAASLQDFCFAMIDNLFVDHYLYFLWHTSYKFKMLSKEEKNFKVEEN